MPEPYRAYYLGASGARVLPSASRQAGNGGAPAFLAQGQESSNPTVFPESDRRPAQICCASSLRPRVLVIYLEAVLIDEILVPEVGLF